MIFKRPCRLQNSNIKMYNVHYIKCNNIFFKVADVHVATQYIIHYTSIYRSKTQS